MAEGTHSRDRRTGRLTEMELEIVLYSRKNCHLCDIAEKVLSVELRKRGWTYRKFDIDAEAFLRDRYSDDVPVVAIQGAPVFKHHLNAQALSAYLDSLEKIT